MCPPRPHMVDSISCYDNQTLRPHDLWPHHCPRTILFFVLWWVAVDRDLTLSVWPFRLRAQTAAHPSEYLSSGP